MKVEQLSIFLENRLGRLSAVTQALADGNVNIRALSLADTSDFGILRLIVKDTAKAKNVLKAAGFTVSCTDVVVVEIDDRPGGLNDILHLFAKHTINIEYMYVFVQAQSGAATVVFRFDNTDEAIGILQTNNVRFVPPSFVNA